MSDRIDDDFVDEDERYDLSGAVIDRLTEEELDRLEAEAAAEDAELIVGSVVNDG